jgi:uncharacterized protein (DUF1778 family)
MKIESRLVNMRMPLTIRTVLEAAARSQSESLTRFILTAIIERARRVLADRPAHGAALDDAETDLLNVGLRY